MNALLASADVFRPRSAQELADCFASLRQASRELAQQPLAALLEPLEQLGQLWQPGTDYHSQGRALLAGTFSRRAVEAALQSLVLGMNPAVLTAGLTREFGRPDLLETWQADHAGIGHVRAFPLGVVAQILAGNVFLGGAIALSQSLLTRNATLLKLSREDSGFTPLFARALRQVDRSGAISNCLAVASWDSSEEHLNEVVRAEADGVVVWGGAAAVAAYPGERCRGRVIHYGPRLGVGFVLAESDLGKALPALAWDVALWEQQACSSPRLVLVEDADPAHHFSRKVAQGLSQALTQLKTDMPPRPLTLDEKAEVLSLRELAWWTGQAADETAGQGMDHTVLLAEQVPPEVPIGYRTVLIVPVPDVNQIPRLLATYRAALQTAVLAAPPSRWPEAVEVLVRAGMTEVAAAGASAARFLGLPHEGEFALRRLVRLIGIDLGAGPLTYPQRDPSASAAVASVLSAGQ
jgi:phenylacetate-CoA ligase